MRLRNKPLEFPPYIPVFKASFEQVPNECLEFSPFRVITSTHCRVIENSPPNVIPYPPKLIFIAHHSNPNTRTRNNPNPYVNSFFFEGKPSFPITSQAYHQKLILTPHNNQRSLLYTKLTIYNTNSNYGGERGREKCLPLVIKL
jgi:hypothetical protein